MFCVCVVIKNANKYTVYSKWLFTSWPWFLLLAHSMHTFIPKIQCASDHATYSKIKTTYIKIRINEQVYTTWKKNLNKSETKNFFHSCFYKMKTKTRKRLSSRGKVLKFYKRNLMLAHDIINSCCLQFLLQFSNSFQTMICILCEFEGCVSL